MAKTGAKVTIKKYANRRLYDTESSAYITLDRLAAMIREGRDFEVVDAKTGEDITHQVLTQIIVDEESRGSTMLPVNFLRQLIGLYGGSMESTVPQYLDAAMDAFSKNQEAMRTAFSGNFGGANVFADDRLTYGVLFVIERRPLHLGFVAVRLGSEVSVVCRVERLCLVAGGNFPFTDDGGFRSVGSKPCQSRLRVDLLLSGFQFGFQMREVLRLLIRRRFHHGLMQL